MGSCGELCLLDVIVEVSMALPMGLSVPKRDLARWCNNKNNNKIILCNNYIVLIQHLAFNH